MQQGDKVRVEFSGGVGLENEIGHKSRLMTCFSIALFRFRIVTKYTNSTNSILLLRLINAWSDSGNSQVRSTDIRTTAS